MRNSYKNLQELAEAMGYKVYKERRLGNRKDYYYFYHILDGENKTIKGSESIKELMLYLLKNKK